MNYKELAESLSKTVESMSISIALLTEEVAQLKALLLEKDKTLQATASKLNGLTKIALPKKTERRKYVDNTLTNKTPAPTPKERGNNGAKRKEYHNIEEVIEEVEPSHPDFEKHKARLISSTDVIRYKYIPQRLIKYIYRCKNYSFNDTVYSGQAPAAPLLNSNFDSSVIASIMQMRYVYGMPVERIVRYYAELGFDLPKQTAHGLLIKGAAILDRLTPVLKEAILSDEYVHFDETYHTVLDSAAECGSRKGYIWLALSSRSNLMHLFYNEGSRAKSVFMSYLPTGYKGAIQCDGYAPYKVLEGWDYPKARRLGCIQHCKRKFLDIQDQPEAKSIIDLYNDFYRIRKHHPKEVWIEKSQDVYEKLENKLKEIERSKECVTNSVLAKGVAYCINELDGIYNIISSNMYCLDNNNIERPIRYISWSRKNSLFCGNGKGAERLALIYSLAISCRLNNVNTFSYFCDVINQIALLPHNITKSTLRKLLPDQWSCR